MVNEFKAVHEMDEKVPSIIEEIKAVHEMNEKVPSIIEEIKKVSEKYEADTLVTGITFIHMLFDAFVDSQKLDREKAYKMFAHDGIKIAREEKELHVILMRKRS